MRSCRFFFLIASVSCASGRDPLAATAGEPLAASAEARPAVSVPDAALAPNTASAPASASRPRDEQPKPSAPYDLTATGEPPAGVPAAAYASLFAPSASWKLSGTLKHTYNDGKPVSTSKRFRAQCKTSAVVRLRWGVRATITCDEDLPPAGSTNLIAGEWFATEHGLYHLVEIPAGGPVLDAEALIFPPTPVARKEEKKDPGMEGFFSSLSVTQEKGGWCFLLTTSMGDDGWQGVCIDPKRGIVSGSYGWAGGSSDEVEFKVEK